MISAGSSSQVRWPRGQTPCCPFSPSGTSGPLTVGRPIPPNEQGAAMAITHSAGPTLTWQRDVPLGAVTAALLWPQRRARVCTEESS